MGSYPPPQFSLSRVLDVHSDDFRSLDYRFPIQDTNDDVVVVMRVTNSGSRAVTLGRELLQCKSAGTWGAWSEPHWLNSQWFVGCLSPKSEEQFVVAVVPSDTESVRLSVEFHPESLVEKWHMLARFQAYRTQDTSKVACWSLVKLDSLVIDPLREHFSATRWPKTNFELTLPEEQRTGGKAIALE
jgi:hypothetical protein